MLKIGLTGGIGSGKSTVADVFRKLGVPVFEADAEARWLQENNIELKNAMRRLLGDDVFTSDGLPNRPAIAQRVFSNPELLAQLNALVHPAVAQHFAHWCTIHHNDTYILKEAAILYESGSDVGLDAVIVVTAPEDVRIERVLQRDKTNREEILKRMSRQWPEEEKTKRATYHINNDGRTMILPQIVQVHELLKTKSTASIS